MNRIQKAIKLVVILALLVGLFSTSTVGLAQGTAPDFFRDADGSGAESGYVKPAHVTRYHYVNVNMNLLLDTQRSLDAGVRPELHLNLFSNAKFTGVITRVEKPSATSTSWIGKLNDIQNGYFYIVQSDNAVIVHVGSPVGIYEASMTGSGVYRVIQIDQSKFGEDAPMPASIPGPILSKEQVGPNADNGSTIDVMVVYTARTRAAEGSVAAMKARIALAVSETNDGYLHAGVTPRLRLVHVEEAAYPETGSIEVDLMRLTNTGDGFMDNIHALRNKYGADMVSLVVENGGPYCGMANAIMATAANAFQVTARACVTGYYSFGHEFGHLQGARHDVYVDPTNSPYSYGHAYVHTSSNVTQRWRTIMAYNDKCYSLGYNCTRLLYWSNPNKTYQGASMGEAGVSENYKVLNNTAVTVANFRPSVIGKKISSNFNSSAAGWVSVYGSWALEDNAYYVTNGIASQSSSIRSTSNFGDLSYQVILKRDGCLSCSNRLLIRGVPSKLNQFHDWEPAYAFQYSNNGAFSVYYMSSAGIATALNSWTISSAIHKGDWNTLKVIAVGSKLKFYINGTQVWSGAHSSLKIGKAGVGMYTDTAVGNKLWLDNATIYNSATSDLSETETLTPGIELSGGDINHSPVP